MQEILSAFGQALGVSARASELTMAQVSLRAVTVFVFWLVIVRLAGRRVLGKYSGYDVVVSVILGAILGGAISGAAPFWAALTAAAVLVALHWMLALLTFRSHFVGDLVKGHPRELVRDGVVNETAMRQNFLTEHDLVEMLRLHARVANPSEARLAVLERNGEISGLPRSILRVVEIGVQSGVQTVRVELSS